MLRSLLTRSFQLSFPRGIPPRSLLPVRMISLSVSRGLDNYSGKRLAGPDAEKGNFVTNARARKSLTGDVEMGGGKLSKIAEDKEDKVEETPSLPVDPEAPTFASLGLPSRIIDNLLLNPTIKIPTEIQRLVLPPLLEGKSVAFCAETGSGKTLSYLLPVTAGVFKSKSLSKQRGGLKALILEPSLELAMQVYKILHSLTKDLNIKVHLIGSGYGLEFDDNVDILVSTPGSLKHFDTGKLFSNLRHVVLDEADALLDGGNRKSIHDVLRVVNELQTERTKEKSDIPLQFVFSAATLPATAVKSPLAFIQEHYPGIEVIRTKGAHKSIPTLKEQFIELPGGKKLPMLLDLLVNSPKKTLIFVRTLENAQKLGEYLATNKVKVAVISKSESVESRIEQMKAYMDGNFTNLICTDLASRGLDFPEVERVIQYDFSLNVVDYIHRGGRTARNGRKGEMVSFVDAEDQDLARAIQKVRSVDNLSSLFSRNRNFRKKFKKAGLAAKHSS